MLLPVLVSAVSDTIPQSHNHHYHHFPDSQTVSETVTELGNETPECNVGPRAILRAGPWAILCAQAPSGRIKGQNRKEHNGSH